MNKIEKQRAHFESVAEKYRAMRRDKNHILQKELLFDYFFKDKDFLKKENLLVLEPMCGYAEGKSILEKHLGVKIQYEGFDYSENLVNFVRRENPLINISVMDATKFQPTKKYDFIFLIGGLHHIPDYCKAVMLKLRDALKDDGYFLNIEPTHDNFLFRKIRERIYRKNPMLDAETEKAFELKELNDIYASADFEIVDQIYPGLSSYVLHGNPELFPSLNIGGTGLVSFLFNTDKIFFRNFIGKKFSFLTMTLLKAARH